jgi:hypothetical protein
LFFSIVLLRQLPPTNLEKLIVTIIKQGDKVDITFDEFTRRVLGKVCTESSLILQKWLEKLTNRNIGIPLDIPKELRRGGGKLRELLGEWNRDCCGD